MSQARPRPRPRPVAKTKNAASSSSTTATVVDSDEMFLRNTSRNLETYKAMFEMNKVERKVRHRSADEDDAPDTPKRKNKKQTKSAPSWQKGKSTDVFAIDISSSDDDDDDELSIVDGKENSPSKKRKRKERQRSRSITPPPAISQLQLQNARNVVRQALARPARAPSPSQYDDFNDVSTDTIILDPELERIAKQSKADFRGSSVPPEALSDEMVEITVKWTPHPLNDLGKISSSVYKMHQTESFSELFEAVADEQSIPVDCLIMTYKNLRFFKSVSPKTLGIWGSAEFLACNKATYDYMRAQSLLPKQKVMPETEDDTVLILSDDEDVSHVHKNSRVSPTPQPEDDGPDDKFKLTFKSALTQGEIVLTVRPTTTCGAIVKAFLKKAGLADKYPHVMSGVPPTAPPKKKGRVAKAAAVELKDPKLCVDGDKLGNDTEIGDMDLEDGDMVEVVGL